MKGKNDVFAGALRALVGPPASSPRRAAKVGGEPPEWIQIFADGQHTTSQAGDEKETWICDADSRSQIIAAFEEKGNDIVIDYEHQTLEGDEAPAAGWIKELADRGEQGLWARVEWTGRAKQYIRAGEYRYYSPVYLVDPKSSRVRQLCNLAITNWPATHNLSALTEQIAAKVRAKFSTNTRSAREGGMDELMQKLQYFLSLPITATHNEARAALQTILEAIPADDQMLIIADKAAAAKAIGEVLMPAPAPAPKEQPKETVAAKALLDELELPETATVAQAHARIGELKTRTSQQQVEQLRNDLKAAKARITELEAKSDDEKVNALVESNRSKIPPAREPWIRAIAKKHGLEHATEVVKNLKEELPPPPSEKEPKVPEVAPKVAATRRVGHKDIPVDPESAIRKAKVEAIQKEDPKKFGDYCAASEELAQREAAASK